MTVAATSAKSADGALARRNALLLAAGQAIIGAAAPVSVSLGALAGSKLLGPDKSLATAPVTGFTVGVAIGAVMAAWLMRLVGRRYGFMLGALLPALGGGLAATALFTGSFWLFALALLVVGFGNAFVQQYRFAAADAAPAAFKPQAISLVLVGGVFAGVIGPQTAIYTQDLAAVHFAGAFLALIPLAAIGIVVLSFLRIREHSVLVDHETEEAARPLGEIVIRFRFVTGLVCAVGSYALMTFMMISAPLAMVGHGYSSDMATLGIQWHVLAMYAPSFFTGRLIGRFGRERVMASGLVILGFCAMVAHFGVELWNFWLALVLLGLGWNFGFIGATSMVTTCYRSSEKNKVEGFHDAILFGCVAVSSLLSGQVLNAYGWNTLSLVFWPILLVCLALLAFNGIREQRGLAAS